MRGSCHPVRRSAGTVGTLLAAFLAGACDGSGGATGSTTDPGERPLIGPAFALDVPRAIAQTRAIAVDDLGIELGKPFEFEIQIDQDFDGGARDGRWGRSAPDVSVWGERPLPAAAPALYGPVTPIRNG